MILVSLAVQLETINGIVGESEVPESRHHLLRVDVEPSGGIAEGEIGVNDIAAVGVILDLD